MSYVTPIYVKASDLPELEERQLGLILCETTAEMVNGQISGALLLNGIWTIQIKTNQARRTLLEDVKILNIRRQRVELHDDYPVISRVVPSEKVTFRDLPFEVEDADILDYLYSCPDIRIKTKNILHARMRNANRELTPFYSGERFIYINGGCKRAGMYCAITTHVL